MFNARRYLLLTYGRRAFAAGVLLVVLTCAFVYIIANRWNQPAHRVLGTVVSTNYNPGAGKFGAPRRGSIRLGDGRSITLGLPRSCARYRVGDTIPLYEHSYRFTARRGYVLDC